MKKILIISLAVIMLFSMSLTGIAQTDNISLDVEFSYDTASFDVSGTVNSTKDRIPMTLIIKRGNSVIGASETLAVFDDTDAVVFAFPTVTPSITTPSGNVTIEVSAKWVNYKATVTYAYVGRDIQLNAMNAVKAAVDGKNASALSDAVKTHSDALGISSAELEGLDETALKVFCANMFTRTYTLPADISTEENCSLVADEVKEFLVDYREAMTLGKFFNLKTTQELDKWYNDNKDAYSLETDIPETTGDETKLVSYVKEAIKSNGFLARRSNMTNVVSMSELKGRIMEQAVLVSIEESNQYIVRTVINDLSEWLSVNTSGFNSVGTSGQSDICLAISGKKYDSFSSFSTAVNDAISTPKPSVNTGSSSGGGFGGGGGSAVSVSKDIIPDTNTAKPALFNDVDSTHWAFESIQYLYSNGIISGKGNGNFAPSDYVTRAELSKMIALAFNLPASSVGLSFNDVDASMWYAPYVSQVYESGIVFGDDKGSFNPTGLVTRQDTLVMLYRAIGTPAADKQAYFEDYADISDYAKSAVDYMCSSGVVNGVGDGMFAPKLSLTRAEAAKIIYNILTK